jgi:tetratricopeptide (TPR) repeat protein
MLGFPKVCGVAGLLIIAASGIGRSEPAGAAAGVQPGAPSDENAAPGPASAVDLHAELGKRHFDHGRYQEAIAEYREAYELKANPAFLLEIAGAYRQIGVVDRSLFFYDRYLETRPDAPDRPEVEAIIADLEASRRAAAEPLRDPARPGAQVLGDDGHLLAQGDAAAGAARPQRGRRPVWRRWWFWGAVGAVAVGAVAAAIAASGGGDTTAPPAELGAKRFF